MRTVAAHVLLAVVLFAGPAQATVELRVEARPISDPIEAFVTVTDVNGPVGGLLAGDFTVTLDGVAVPLGGFTLPPSQDPNQRVSVVFVMDYSSSVQSVALTAMQDAVIAFINAMNTGDFAAIIKFNDTNPDRASVVQPFTAIDGGAGTSALIGAVMAPYPGEGTNLLDAINLAIAQFNAPPVPLPSGPKAIIAITDGGENASSVTESTVIAGANGSSLPLFMVGVGNVTNQVRLDLLNSLATNTGGDYLSAPSDAEIAAAYATISQLLNSEYLLTIPSTISDCGEHTLQVTVAGQGAPVSATFRRCDDTPNAFSFTNRTDVARDTVLTSNAVTISGIDVPVQISVSGGEYSIGCGATFTSANGTIDGGQAVCVRHTSSSSFSTMQVTTLTVGGVAGTFTSTTRAAPPPTNRGGGGALGVVELLLGLTVLVSRRRRQSSSQMRIT